MSRINYKIFLTSILSFFFFFSFFQSSQAGFFDWFRKNNSQSSQSTVAVVSSAKQYILSVSKSGSGVVTSDDGKINCGKQCKASYSASSKIVLKAEAGDNYKFERWNGCDKVSDGKCQTTLNKSKMIVVKFVKKANSSSSLQKSSSLSARKASSSKYSSSKSSSTSSKLSSSSYFSGASSSKVFSSSSSLVSKSSSPSSYSSALLEEIGNDSDWKLMGPSDGRVNTVVILSNNELLIGAKSGGVFRSINNRSSWKSSSDGLGSRKIYFLNKIKNKIFAATGDGLYLFNENGSSWQKVYQYGVPFKEFFTVKEDIDGNIWALSEDGLFFSKDGFSWEKNNSISIEKALTVVVKTPDLLLASKKGDLYVITKNGLYQSKDKGVIWKNIFTEATSITEDEKGAIYVVTSAGKLYKKDYNKDAFYKIDFSFNPKSGVVYYNNSVLYLESLNVLLISRDFGKTFEEISEEWSWEKGFWDIRQMLSGGDNKIILANDNGVSEVDINNKSIKKYPKIKGYSEVTSFSLTQSGEKLTMAVAYWDHASVFSFAGSNWNAWSGGEFDNHYLDPQGSNFIVTCTNNELSTRIMKGNGTRNLTNDYSCAGSNNNAVVFDDRENPSKAYVIAIKKNNGKRVLLSFKATSDSSNFNLEERDISDTYAGSIAIDPSNKSRLVVLGDNKLQETFDGGKTWSLFADLSGRTGFKISINPFNSKEAMLSGLFGNIIKINNGNVSDLKLPYDMSKVTDNFVYSVAYDDKKQNVLYAASQQGLFYSLDNGESWNKFNKGLYSKDIRVVIPIGDRVFIGIWGSGIASIKKDILLKSNENN